MPNYVEISSGWPTRSVPPSVSRSGRPTSPTPITWAGRSLALDFKVGQELEDDAGIPFEEMPYVLTVRDFQRGQVDKPAAREMFARLERLGCRPMYLVRGLQEILASID